MPDSKLTHTVINKRLEGDVLTGPYRQVREGENADKDHSIVIKKHDGTTETLIPVRIYGPGTERR